MSDSTKFFYPKGGSDRPKNKQEMYNNFKRKHMNFDQIRQFAPQLIKIARKHGITKIYVFGSIARGNSTPRSDVDFLVEMQEGQSLFGAAGFGYEAELLLGIPVDVVPISTLSQVKDNEFVFNIQNEAVAL